MTGIILLVIYTVVMLAVTFKTFYEGLYIGDPKERKLRALLNSVAIEGAKKR